jgi:hypothetical protein
MAYTLSWYRAADGGLALMRIVNREIKKPTSSTGKKV